MTPNLFIIIMLAIIAGMSIGSFMMLILCEHNLEIIVKTLGVEFLRKHLDELNQMINHMDGKEESTDA